MADNDDNKGGVIGPYMDLGLQLAIAVLIGTALGYWLDKKLHTTPLLLLIGVLLGGTAGFITIYKTVYPVIKQKRSGKRS
ncbi:MAG TPA: AtpZ/AtpI family protein [bacterium]|nr:AtpZ/AtpI family protein [bacterium]HQG45977.1 AtpZ/AtpI family protein [bacterium]HQI49249.1 AtpZ/AtpI family protein [bacterium]HQJ63573.1 AtpZ/AtpI family protein [bacterium]